MSYSVNYRYTEIAGVNATSLTETQLVVDLSYKAAGYRGLLLSEAPLKEFPTTPITVLVGATPYTEVDITAGAPSGTNFCVEYSSNSGVIYLPTSVALGTSCTVTYKGVGTVASIESKQYNLDGTVGAPGISFANDTNTGIYRQGADTIGIVTNGIERERINNNGFQSVIPGGSVLYPEYKCRAWVNFDGSLVSPISPRGSGNVSTVAKLSANEFTVNFIQNIADTNYSATASIGNFASIAINQVINVSEYNTNNITVRSTTSNTTSPSTMSVYSVAIFR